jgi:site-specific DNA recombinase
MTKAAIYARFSSDLQSDRSIEDQQVLCREFAQRSAMTVVATFEDRARSGASILGRDGLLSLMERSRTGEFDTVVVEALDRLSRDQEDLAGIYKRLSFAGIKIIAVHEGQADQMQIGIRGLVGALFLQDLSHKVRRGMAGVTRDGRHAGGRAYGYRPVVGSPGELLIVSEEAEVIRRIFAEFAAGGTPRQIASGLNKDRIAAPRGDSWAASVLAGNKKRGYGILLNPLYAGTIVWNRVRMIKDPSTGRRVSRSNPEKEWQRADAPHLAIVDRETFEAVQARLADRAIALPAHRRQPKHLLSGLLKCGCCGAGMSVKDIAAGRVRVHCTGAKEGGTCTNRKAVYLDKIETPVLAGLKRLLSDPRAVAAYISAYNEERRQLARDISGRKGASEKRLRQVTAEIDRTIGMVVKGLISEDEAAQVLPPLRAERGRIENELASLGREPSMIRIHPRAAEAYLAAIARLGSALDEGDREASRAEVRKLIERVVVTPGENSPTIQLDGWLSSVAFGDLATDPRLGGKVVAGERYRASPQSDRLPFSLQIGETA